MWPWVNRSYPFVNTCRMNKYRQLLQDSNTQTGGQAKRGPIFHQPIFIRYLKLQSTHVATNFDFKISQHKRSGGAAEVYPMPGCFYCQQVCCFQLLLLSPPAKTQHLDATVLCVCRVAQQIPFFILSFLSLKSASGFWLNLKKKSSTTPSWRDNGVSSQIVRGRHATLPSPGSPWCSLWC